MRERLGATVWFWVAATAGAAALAAFAFSNGGVDGTVDGTLAALAVPVGLYLSWLAWRRRRAQP